ncbi:glycosyltransferase [Hymenobacter setariae]|uniref:Glycosyltransferase n=1 Tax=Hymenobacter setariae TaxID=2594794 RepID=A0A558C489_9BACT|nr:glycosyltransferase [Hymenobacter setariae]TVT43609.1 glycosyltransferase [Hymenobacter setariae]
MSTLASRFPTTAPIIAALPDSVTRPVWSVMIPVYNCAVYLEDALQSVLQQDLGEEAMQIQVVDDASTDLDVQALVERIGGGRVEYFRQPENVGSLRNFETCINRARGHIVHLLHGDDRIVPGFYTKMEALYQRYPEIGAAFSRYVSISEEGNKIGLPAAVDEEGVLSNWLERIAQHQPIQYACMTVRREVYERLGSFYGTSYGEDWEMWVRIARYYPVAYTPEVLANYRIRTHSITWEKSRNSQIVPDLLNVLGRIQSHLPNKDRKKIIDSSKKYCAHMMVYNTYRVFKELKDARLAHTQIKQALNLSNHYSIYFSIAKFYLKCAVEY